MEAARVGAGVGPVRRAGAVALEAGLRKAENYWTCHVTVTDTSMAKYNYDDGGILAAYFLFSVLALLLVPASISTLIPARDAASPSCRCSACLAQRTAQARLSRRFRLTKRCVKTPKAASFYS